MTKRPEIFVSATSRDLRSCRQQVSSALLTLGCIPVTQENFPPAAGEVRAMLRERIAACDAVIHLAGLCYGYEPQERPPGEPRRSYTQMEYDTGRELKKPVYTFVCSESFPYDPHEPEPEDRRLLQQAHRDVLTNGDQLYQPISGPEDLALRVRELQTRVEQMSRELQKTRSWLGRGLVIAILVLGLVGAALWFQQRRVSRTEQRASQSEQKLAQVGGELDRYRQAVKLLADRYGKDLEGGRKLTPEEKLDRALASVAEEQKVSVGELKTWMDLFVTQVRANPGADFYDRALADFAEQRFADAAANAKKSAEQFRTQREAAEQAAASASERAAQARDKEGQGWTLAGDSEYAAGHYAAAVEMYQSAIALVDKEKAPLAWCDAGQKLESALVDQGQYADAEPLARELVAKRTALQGKENPATLRSVNGLAILLLDAGKFAEAEPLFRECLEIRERVLGRDHADTLQTVNSLANLELQGKGDNAAAEALYRRALEARERTLGEDNPSTLVSVNNLANLMLAKNDLNAAEGLLRRGLAGREKVLGKDHPQTLTSINNLAILLSMKNDYAEAETLFRRALDVQERTLGKEHPDTLRSLNNLGRLLQLKGDLAGAGEMYRLCLEGRERVLGKEHHETLTSVNNLAQVLQAQHNFTEAEALYRRALDARDRTLGKDHPDTLDTAASMASMYRDKGDFAVAEPLYRRVLGGLPDGSPQKWDAAYNLSLMLQKQQKTDEALAFAQQAAEDADKHLPETSPDRRKYDQQLADLRAGRIK